MKFWMPRVKPNGVIAGDDVEVVDSCGKAGASLIADEVEFGVGSMELESSILIDCWQE